MCLCGKFLKRLLGPNMFKLLGLGNHGVCVCGKFLKNMLGPNMFKLLSLGNHKVV